MSHTLLVWETVPEDTDLYLIPNEVANKFQVYLEQAHHRFINCDNMNDGMKFLNTALGDEAPEEGFEEHLGVLREYKCDKQPILDKTITAVYLSGFVL